MRTDHNPRLSKEVALLEKSDGSLVLVRHWKDLTTLHSELLFELDHQPFQITTLSTKNQIIHMRAKDDISALVREHAG